MTDQGMHRTRTALTPRSKGHQPARWAIWGGVSAAMLLLAGCADEEVILAGKRQDIRSVLQDPTLAEPEQAADPVNQTRPIALARPAPNASWSHTIGTPKYRTGNAALSRAPALLWSANIGQGDTRKLRITADPVVSGGRVFTLDAGAQVVATSTSGATVWTRDLTPVSDKAGEGSGGGLVVDGNTVYVSIGFGVLVALDASSGSVRWTQELDASGSGTPTVYGDLVYVTAGDDTGWAVNKTSGKVEWQVGATTNISNILGAPAPAVTDKFAIFAFGSGEVQGVFRRGGVNRWTASTLGRRPGRALSYISDVTSAPVVSGGTVYVGNQSGRLVALDVESGNRKWTAQTGAIGPAFPAGGSVFVISDLNELVRLDASDGSRIWGAPLPKFVKTKPRRQSRVFAHYGPIIAGGRVIVASNDGMLRSFDPASGASLGQVEIPGGATTAPVVAGGTLYVVSAKGQLHALR